jgi:hypothetical protein
MSAAAALILDFPTAGLAEPVASWRMPIKVPGRRPAAAFLWITTAVHLCPIPYLLKAVSKPDPAIIGHSEPSEESCIFNRLRSLTPQLN